MSGMNEDLDYNFTEGSNILDTESKSNPDVGNVSILTELLQELSEQKKQFSSIKKLNIKDESFTIEQQVANNQWALSLLDEVILKISERVKELGDGR